MNEGEQDGMKLDDRSRELIAVGTSVSPNQRENTSVWLALKNRIFIGLWLASLVSGFCVSAHDTAATWLMNSLDVSPFFLSLMATSASLPFFLFTLPSGAISDLVNRRNLFIGTYLWLAATAGLLAVCTWLRLVNPYLILTTVFLLGVGFAFNAPVWAAIVPEVVRKEELASAITLGGVQMNLGGIVGPALAALLLPIAGPAMLFSLSALAFLFAALMIARRYREGAGLSRTWKTCWNRLPARRGMFGTHRGCRSF
jgi:MFS family permease